MTEKKKEKEKDGADFDIGSLGDLGGTIGGIFKGLGGLIDLASKLKEAGGEMNKAGEFDLGEKFKNLKGAYGFNIRTATGKDGTEKPIVEPIGRKVRETPEGPVVEEELEPIVDVFDEVDKIQVVAELPGVTEDKISYEIEGDILTLHAEGKKKYSKEILLSSAVDKDGVTTSYKNGVYELKMKKVKQ